MTTGPTAQPAMGPAENTAQEEAGLTRAGRPRAPAARARPAAEGMSPTGQNRHAGEGRCPAEGARQTQTEWVGEWMRATQRPEKRAGTEKNRLNRDADMATPKAARPRETARAAGPAPRPTPQ